MKKAKILIFICFEYDKLECALSTTDAEIKIYSYNYYVSIIDSIDCVFIDLISFYCRCLTLAPLTIATCVCVNESITCKPPWPEYDIWVECNHIPSFQCQGWNLTLTIPKNHFTDLIDSYLVNTIVFKNRLFNRFCRWKLIFTVSHISHSSMTMK